MSPRRAPVPLHVLCPHCSRRVYLTLRVEEGRVYAAHGLKMCFHCGEREVRSPQADYCAPCREITRKQQYRDSKERAKQRKGTA